MTIETIEGEVREIPSERALVPAQPGQAIVASATDPAAMVAVATKLADVLADIVERKKLYATISGRKYPQVEAWMTIARLDNVVAREARPAERHDDGSWEAFAELVRLSDGMVIGSSSALCGDPGDRPWNTRADYQKRSMAQTRATSRAFRQQYAWVMALAGYEPTPAEEMPQNDERTDDRQDHDGLIGRAEAGASPADFELRETPDGSAAVAFKLSNGRKGFRVNAKGPLAFAIHANRESIEGQTVTCYGSIGTETFDKGGRTITYATLALERLVVGDLTLPPDDAALSATAEASSPARPVETPAPDSSTPAEKEQPVQPRSAGAADPAVLGTAEEAPAEAAESPGSAADAACGAPSPYGDGLACEFLPDHKGPHGVVSQPFPTKWTD